MVYPIKCLLISKSGKEYYDGRFGFVNLRFVHRGLRSTDEVTGYEIVSGGKTIGEVEDFIVDDENWTIRYLVLDTKKFLNGKKVIIAPEWIHGIIWNQRQVSVDIPKEKLEKSPAFDDSAPLTRKYEESIYSYYGGTKYWE